MTALGCSGQLIGQRQVRVSPSKTPLKANTRRRGGDGVEGNQRAEWEQEEEEEVEEARAPAVAATTADAEAGSGAGPTRYRVEKEAERDIDGDDDAGRRVGEEEEEGAKDQVGSLPIQIASSASPSDPPAGGAAAVAVLASMEKLGVRDEDSSKETAAA